MSLHLKNLTFVVQIIITFFKIKLSFIFWDEIKISEKSQKSA